MVLVVVRWRRQGGVVYMTGADTTFNSCTVSGNSAAGNGGGLYLSGNANIYRTYFSENTATSANHLYISANVNSKMYRADIRQLLR